MALFKSLKFDGEDSLDYGVHITGESVYNAPERDVEMIQVPGRNGEYALDHGRFNNIEVSYPAGMGEVSQEEFASKISAFRNALASKKGYYRLEDDYHLDEYRMGIYKSGLEVSPVQYGRAGEFNLVFNCKPQRFLKSGEQRTELTESGVINNPTPFDSQPLLELTGYGTLEVNGSTIELHNDPAGVITLANSGVINGDTGRQVFITNEFYSGDTITHNGFSCAAVFNVYGGQASSISVVSDSGGLPAPTVSPSIESNGRRINVPIVFNTPFTLSAGTYSGKSRTVTCEFSLNGNTYRVGVYVSFVYNPATQYFAVSQTVSGNAISGGICDVFSQSFSMLSATVDSTYLPLGSPLYLDCEIGEAYKIENDQIVLINNNVDIPSDLPVLSPGENQITMDSTYTKVGIIPRWWII